MKAAVLLGVGLLLGACAPPVQNLRSTTPSPASDVYTCAMRELARLEYTVVDADREAGFIRAEKQDTGGMSGLAGADYYTEITVTVIPAEAGGSDLQVNARRSKQEGSGARTSSGLIMTEGARAEANTVLQACGGA